MNIGKGFIAALAVGLSASLAAETIAIVGADIHTLGDAGTVRGGTVLISDGKLSALGLDIEVPADARRIEASGQVITPGLFHAISRLGITEVGAVESTVDYQQVAGTPFSASFDPSLAFNPRSSLIGLARSEGVSHALIAPISSSSESTTGGVFAGLGTVIQLSSVTDYTVRSPAAMLVQLGVEGGELNDGSRARALQLLSLALKDAADYAINKVAYEGGARRDYSVSASDLDALQDVLLGKIPLIVEAHRESDLRQLITMADQHKFRLIISGASEAWRLANELAAADIGVIIEPMDNLPQNFDRLDSNIENAARLHRAGVKFAINEGNSHIVGNLKQGAGNAVAHGLPWIAGLHAITQAPAELFGLGDALGSIRVGEPANLVLWDGDPLEVTSFAVQVWIDGQNIERVSRQMLLRDRYHPDKLATPLPPAYR